MKCDNLLKNTRQEIDFRGKLRNIAKRTNIFNPIETKNYIINYKKRDGTNGSDGLKIVLQEAYVHFAKANSIPYDRFTINYEAPIPLIPSKENIDVIINNAPEEYYTPYKIMEETAVEPQELHDTPISRIDPHQGTISITGVKKHSNGVYKLSDRTANDLRLYLAKHNEQYPFPTARRLGSEWTRIKQRRAKELNKPELLKIQLKSLRNYAGAVFYLTMGKDPIATKNFMRHKRLEQTMDYLRGITEFSLQSTRITKLVNTPEEAIELIKQGFKEDTIFYQGTPNEKHILSKIKI